MRDAFGVVSKIALRPVYHGTSPAGATKLKRLLSSKTPATAGFKTYDVPGDPRPRGLYTSPKKYVAEDYSSAGKAGGRTQKRGKVLMFNSVGVKPKYKDNWQEIYDPKDLGAPLSTSNVRRRVKAAPRVQTMAGSL